MQPKYIIFKKSFILPPCLKVSLTINNTTKIRGKAHHNMQVSMNNIMCKKNLSIINITCNKKWNKV